jgi:translation initiation factor 2 subunit 3
MCGSKTIALRTVSFVDMPGHESLMATVLGGTALLDMALLVIAADEPCPQPQTREHLMALEIADIKKVVIVQNKIDLVSEREALKNYEQIKRFVRGTTIEGAEIVPVSALQRAGIDALLHAIQKIPTPKRDEKTDPLLFVARSFDVNKPGTSVEKLIGGVLGGALISGKLHLGDKLEIQPGIEIEGRIKPLLTKVSGLQKAGKNLSEAGPGGLLGVGTELDPALTKADSLAGSMAGLPGKVPQAVTKLSFSLHLFKHVIGAKEEVPVEDIKTGELLMVTCGISRAVGRVISAYKNRAEIELTNPFCVKPGARITISRQVENKWRLIGLGVMK